MATVTRSLCADGRVTIGDMSVDIRNRTKASLEHIPYGYLYHPVSAEEKETDVFDSMSQEAIQVCL